MLSDNLFFRILKLTKTNRRKGKSCRGLKGNLNLNRKNYDSDDWQRIVQTQHANLQQFAPEGLTILVVSNVSFSVAILLAQHGNASECEEFLNLAYLAA